MKHCISQGSVVT